MQHLMDYKWLLLISLEITSWIFTILIFYARYWLNSKRLTIFFALIDILVGWIPHVVLMVINVLRTKTLGLFDVIIIIIITYSLTFGKKHIQMIDLKIKIWTDKKRGLKKVS